MSPLPSLAPFLFPFLQPASGEPPFHPRPCAQGWEHKHQTRTRSGPRPHGIPVGWGDRPQAVTEFQQNAARAFRSPGNELWGRPLHAGFMWMEGDKGAGPRRRSSSSSGSRDVEGIWNKGTAAGKLPVPGDGMSWGGAMEAQRGACACPQPG